MKKLLVLVIALGLTSCMSTKKMESMVNANQPGIDACQRNVLSAQQARVNATPQFTDQRDQLLYAIVVRLVEKDDPFSHCDDVLITLINADTRIRTAGITAGTSLTGLGIGVLGVTSVADSFAELGAQKGNTSSITGSRVVQVSGDGNGNSSASGDGLGLLNSLATDESTSVGGQQPRVVTTVANDNSLLTVGTQSSSGTDEPLTTQPVEVDNTVDSTAGNREANPSTTTTTTTN